MQLTTIFSVAILDLSVTAQPCGPNGKRICVGSAISCEHQKGRSANICNDSRFDGTGTPAVIDPPAPAPAPTPALPVRPIMRTPVLPALVLCERLGIKPAKRYNQGCFLSPFSNHGWR
jgi:hypothetical protein